MSAAQLIGVCPALSQALFSYSHVVESADAPARALAITGSRLVYRCVNPAQDADNDSDGPQVAEAAFTPQPAARSRWRSALSAGFCSSAIFSRSPSCQAGVCTAKLSVSCTVATSTGADTPICWNRRSFSTCTAVSACNFSER